ncbi:hypothetical protein HPB47_017578 [Ixodes persulcatus]|uniref:Uncharacterized protein n=1 Tax=Ixodes persulcatus TaxID=34615 RepID=A0AC60QNW9_IXOPE|nr:hypothetical protein HPB47_017578 [Ixodes persulcatus]
MPNANQNDADQNTDQNSNLSPNIEATISKIPSTTDYDPIIMDAQFSLDGEILNSDAALDDGGEWSPARAPRKRRYKETSSQDTEKDVPRTESLTVIFVPTKEVKAYEGLAGPTVEGVIKNVDVALPETKIAGRLRSDTEIARVRRFGSSECVWITFRGRKLPSHVLLGRVRHPVMEFHHRPTQYYRCGGFGLYAVTCKRSVVCSRCAALQNPKSNPTHDGASTPCQRALETVTTKKHIVPENISVPEAKGVVPA